ncbi:MAG TPA: aminoglycoside phosphotransferase family protein [Pyrinomonadaceae bacterium]|nr:aminoglycoside phosphotransferase family protein [Pyrinomonadaceae bacterium]
MTESESTYRLQQRAREWDVNVERTVETESSLVAFGERSSAVQSVVLKIIKQPGDEWRAGEVLKAFDGRGVVRVYEHAPGAVLMERLSPGTPLVDLVLNGKDDEATDILAVVMQQMSEPEDVWMPGIGRQVSAAQWRTPLEANQPKPDTRYQTPAFPTTYDWARGFDRYIASRDGQIPRDLVESAQQIYVKLAATQREPRLLHGDLQHYNVLFDSVRGWVAIDPKGVIGEVEYEIGAAMRNPVERPDLFLSPQTIARRLKQFTDRLNLDYNRTVRWTFAQSVLSAIWNVEDGFEVGPLDSSLRLAKAILPMIEMP